MIKKSKFSDEKWNDYKLGIISCLLLVGLTVFDVLLVQRLLKRNHEVNRIKTKIENIENQLLNYDKIKQIDTIVLNKDALKNNGR